MLQGLFQHLKRDELANLRLFCGWLLMISASVYAWRNGLSEVSGHRTLATILMVILGVACLFTLNILGSIHQLRTWISLIITCVTAYLIILLSLNNDSELFLAELFQKINQWIVDKAGGVVGAEIADLLRPLEIICLFLILFGVAKKSPVLIFAPYILVLLCAVFPPNTLLVAASLLWVAGFLLVKREPLLLSAETLQVLPALNEHDERFLRRLEDDALNEKQAIALLDNSPASGTEDRARYVRNRLEAFNREGLIGLEPQRGLLVGTHKLKNNAVGPIYAQFSNVLSLLASSVIIVLGIIYFMLPIDLLPEAVLGAVGWIDDVVIILFAGQPLIAHIPILKDLLQRNNKARAN